MSYDYLLVKAGVADDFEGVASNFESGGIGPLEEIKVAINRIFPSTNWSPVTISTEVSAGVGVVSGMSAAGGAPEFQLMTDSDGNVSMISMSRAERPEVEQVAREFGLTVVDEQSMEIFNG